MSARDECRGSSYLATNGTYYNSNYKHMLVAQTLLLPSLNGPNVRFGPVSLQYIYILKY